MKKNLKVCLLGISCLSSVGLVSLSGCSDKKQDDPIVDPVKDITITLSDQLLPLESFQTYTLGVVVEGSDMPVTFTSSDESIATVDSTGLITAKDKVGQIQITATVEGVSTFCDVIVTKSLLAPSIVLTKNKINLGVSSTFNVGYKVLWGSEDITNIGTISYSILSGEENVSVSKNNGTFEIKALKLGNAKIQVEYEGRGYLSTEVIEVEVINDSVSIREKNGNIEYDELGFATEVSCVAEEGYVNVRSFEFEAFFGSEKKDGTFSFNYLGSESSSHISLSTSGNGIILSGKKAGTAQIEGTFTSEGVETKFVISIEIIKPVLNRKSDLQIEVENLVSTGYKIQTLDIVGDVGTVTYNGQEIGSYRNSRLYISKDKLPTNSSLLGDVTINLEVEQYIYNIDVEMYSLIINTPAELDRMIEIAKNNEINPQYADGYFILGNDIDYGGKTIASMFTSDELSGIASVGPNGWYKGTVCGFKGIFDGRGFNISNINVSPKEDKDVYTGGIFGILATGGEIRNVSFYNASVRAETAFLFTSGDGLVENVYIHYKSIGYNENNRWSSSLSDDYKRNYCGSFYTYAAPDSIGANARVYDTIIDASKAKIYNYNLKDASEKTINNYAIVTNRLNNFTPIALALHDEFYDSSLISASFKGLSVKSITDENPEALNFVNNLSSDVWHKGADLVVFKTLIDSAASEISLSASMKVAHGGDEIELTTNMASSLLDFEVSDKTVGAFKHGNFVINDQVDINKDLTIKVTSKINPSKSASISVNIAKNVTLGNIGKIYLNESENNGAITYGQNAYDFNIDSQMSRITSHSSFGGIVLNGSVYSSAENVTFNETTNTISIPKEIIGTIYGNRSIYARFDGIDYEISATFVSKVLTVQNELKTFWKLGKLLEPSNTHLYGGYFELGSNIDCDYYDFDEHGSSTDGKFTFEIGNDANRKDSMGESFLWDNTLGKNVLVYRFDGTDGFKGVFDGCGYGINNFTIKHNWLFGGFISVMHNEGVLRNIAFTNARIGVSNGATIPYSSASIVQAGGGLVENVYVTRPFIPLTRPADGLFYNKNYLALVAKPTLRNIVVDDSRWNGKSYEELCPHNMNPDVTGGNVINSTACCGIGVDNATLSNVCLATTNTNIIETFTFTNTLTNQGITKHLKNDDINIKGTMADLYATMSQEFIDEWTNVWKPGSGVVLPVK